MLLLWFWHLEAASGLLGRQGSDQFVWVFFQTCWVHEYFNFVWTEFYLISWKTGGRCWEAKFRLQLYKFRLMYSFVYEMWFNTLSTVAMKHSCSWVQPLQCTTIIRFGKYNNLCCSDRALIAFSSSPFSTSKNWSTSSWPGSRNQLIIQCDSSWCVVPDIHIRRNNW